LPPASSNQISPPIFAHTVEDSMEVLPPAPRAMSQDARTSPANVQDTNSYLSSTPLTSQQWSRHNSLTQAQYPDIPSIPLNYRKRPHEDYSLTGQAQAHMVPPPRDSSRGKAKSTEPVASSAFSGSSQYNSVLCSCSSTSQYTLANYSTSARTRSW
jgi:hypothetical protein